MELKSIKRKFNNAFWQWAADMNSGETYDRTGKIVGFYYAERKWQDEDGKIHLEPKRYVEAEQISYNKIAIKSKQPIP